MTFFSEQVTRVREVLDYGWGGSTNIEAAYGLLLQLATPHKLSPAFMGKMCLVIFSDMEFDAAHGHGSNCWQTMHEHIVDKFERAGYPKIPKTVYWNLRASRSQPVRDQDQEDVVLLSGFSPALLRSFLAGSWEDFTPLSQMLKAISGPLYQELVCQ